MAHSRVNQSPAAKAHELEYAKRYRVKHLERLRAKSRDYMQAWKERDPVSLRAYAVANRRRMRLAVFAAYGGKCECCGEDTYEFLTIDHINGGGRRHREEIGGSGSSIYSWLRRNNFPAGFQILCMNCNFAAGKFGGCPHTAKTQ
jgi:hypothetical protein